MTDEQSLPEGTKLPLDIEIQYHILHLMTKNENFLSKCLAYLKEEYFENQILGWFFKTIASHYKLYKQLLHEATLRNEILSFAAEDQPKYEVALERIVASAYHDEDYLRQQLTGWLRSRKFIKLHKDMEILYNSNQRESAYDVTKDAIGELKELNFTQDRTIDFEQSEEWISLASKSSENRIPIGIPEIDNALLGGLKRQALTTLLGVTNAGKTVMMINMAFNAMKAGHKVLYIYHEGDDQTMALRFLSRITKIPYFKFYSGIASLTDEERQKLAAAKALLANRLVLKPMCKFGLLVDDMVSYCRSKKSDFNYNLLIDDYAQLMRPNSPSKELRHNQSEVFRGLSALASELDIAIVSAAQGNRSAFIESQKGKKLLGLGDISECFDICMASECVITLTRSQDDQVNDRAYILLAKQREGQVNVGVEVRTDLKRLTMYDKNLGITSLRLSENHEVLGSDDEHVQTSPLNSGISSGAVSPNSGPSLHD